MNKRGNSIKRRSKSIKKRRKKQEARRRVIGICVVVLLVIVLLVSCTVRSCSRKKGSEEQKESKKQSEEVTQETAQEKLERVEKEAKEAGYPEKVIELLSKNPETVDFVDHYEEKKDSQSPETIEEFQSGTIPHLLQWDERWGYASYGTSNIAVSGCGPTCMAMVLSYLKDDASLTPVKLGKYAEENGHLTKDNSTLWTFMSDACMNWGVTSTGCGVDEAQIERTLNAGNPIICNVGEGDFTENGHYIVLTAYKDGKVSVLDPFSMKNTEKEWVYNEIKDQIKGSWSYSLN